MPQAFIEVEHTTDINRSLIKFVELQDFFADFWIAASEKREQEFRNKLNQSAFEKIDQRVKFLGYEKVSIWHPNLTQRWLEIGM